MKQYRQNMVHRTHTLKKHSDTKKPSKLVTVFALTIAFSLPYFLVTHFSKPDTTNEEYTNFSLSLPELKKPQVAVHEFKEEDDDVVQEPIPRPQVVKENEWFTLKPRPGDSLASIFHRLGLSAKNLHALLDKNPHARVLTNINPRQEIRFLISKNQLEKLIIPMNTRDSLTMYRSGTTYKPQITSKKTSPHNQYLTATVKGSLFNTAKNLNIPYKFVRQMTEILGRQVDFAHAVRAGDQFSIAYEALYIEDKMVGFGDVLAVSYTSKGKTYEAVGHTYANGSREFYTPQGMGLKKAFSRYPLRFSHISSTFALSRYHPILHYRRAHKGIDLAAPIGTPIQAIGDGVIKIIGRHNGYGNMIEIQHDKTYSSVYGHMLKFQKGLSRGSQVTRGQVIGYVGQSGLANGPHCHYEVHVNHVPKNPTTINLPTSAAIPSRELKTFKAKAGTLLARLRLMRQSEYASRSKRNLG